MEIMPGLRWICLPLPFALNHVNAWVIGDNETGLTIDTGINTRTTRELWQALVSSHDLPVQRLLITHYHPDHIGLAGWFVERWQSRTLFSDAEYQQAQRAWSATDEQVRASLRPWYLRNGLDSSRVEMMAETGNSYRPLVAKLPEAPDFLTAGESLLDQQTGTWQVLEGNGHSPQMICLYNEELNVLVSADQVLPSITPNISLTWYLSDDDPMASFLGSLPQFLDLPADVLVLPSHGLPFRGLHRRVTDLLQHHEDRFDSLVDFCSVPRSVADCLPHLFKRELDRQQLMFGMGESLAHLRYLHRSGRLKLFNEQGVDTYCVS